MSLLANHWAARGEDVSLITIDSTDTDSYQLESKVQRFALGLMADSNGPFSALANNARRIVRLRAALKQSGARVVLSFGEHANVQLLLAAAFLGIRCVISERTDPERHPVTRMWRALRRLAYPSADALVVQTRGLLPWACSIVKAERAYVIPNPVRNMRHVRQAQSLESGPTIVAAGRLVRAKGFDLLLEAFACVVREIPQCRLVILGDGPERDALLGLARQLGVAEKFFMPGRVSEPGEILMNASCFVLSSHYEGFPNALLEAMACGLPVISTACRGPVEILKHEVDGLLVQVGSASALATAMLRLMKDECLRRTLGANAKDVCVRYQLDTVIEAWDQVLKGRANTAQAALHHTTAT
jgi:glycosyltransferase involved in cell wall biosynthesis